MKIRRREMLHLLGASGGWLSGAHLLGCGDPELATEPAACTDEWWLCDNFAPVDEIESTTLEIVGNVPSSLVGVYARNGPNPTSGTSGHWFTGDGMVHALRLEGGEAKWFRARYIQTDLLKNGPPEGIGPPQPTMHQANTSLLHRDDQLLCLSEAGIPYAITRTDLETVGPFDFGGQLEASMTAHPKVDPATGELVFFGYDALSSSIRYYVADPAGTFTHQETIALPAPIMMHDFQITASHIVWLDLPILFDLDLAIAGDSLPFSWAPKNGARIGVMPRDGGDAEVIWFDIDLCFIFHTFNAFNDPNDPNKIILDAIRYPEVWVTSNHDPFPNNQWWRYTMNLTTGEVTEEQMGERTMEFPRIDPRRQGTPNRYAYALGKDDNVHLAGFFNEINKLDIDTGTRVSHVFDGNLVIGEPTFVPDSDGAGEDEGWLIAYSYDGQSDLSELLVLDASDIEAGPVGRVQLPQRVPHGFHGTWSPG
jgi:carotenoid cleavage dioxygenase